MTGQSRPTDDKKNVLSDKERFSHDESSQKLKHMGEKSREAQHAPSRDHERDQHRGGMDKPKG